ncbi:MAG: hypothetical protein WCF08_09485 [Anaerolineaceae bacterium]
MPKSFITERDVEDMAKRGIMELAIDDNTVLTDLAYEKANRLGVRLLQQNDQPPASPIRPYLSQPVITPAQPSQKLCSMHESTPVDGDLKKKVIEAVTARLGSQVDAGLLTTIVERVFADLGVR